MYRFLELLGCVRPFTDNLIPLTIKTYRAQVRRWYLRAIGYLARITSEARTKTNCQRGTSARRYVTRFELVCSLPRTRKRRGQGSCFTRRPTQGRDQSSASYCQPIDASRVKGEREREIGGKTTAVIPAHYVMDVENRNRFPEIIIPVNLSLITRKMEHYVEVPYAHSHGHAPGNSTVRSRRGSRREERHTARGRSPT